MATKELPILGWVGDATNPPLTGFANGRPYLIFDEDTDQLCVQAFDMPEGYVSNPVLVVEWSGSSSTNVTHTTRFACRIMKATPETHGAMDSDSYDTSNEVDDDILGTTAKRLQKASVTCTNDDGVAAGDYVAAELSRNADHANDTLPEPAWVWKTKLEYSTS